MNLTSEQLAWIAGLFDGEGNVTIYRDRYKNRPGGSFTLIATVGMTSRLPLDFLRQNFGGSVQAKPKRLAHHSQAWHWRVSSQKAEVFLRAIRPYLMVKAEETEVGLALRDVMARYRSGHRFSDDELRERVGLQQKLFTLRPGRPSQRRVS